MWSRARCGTRHAGDSFLGWKGRRELDCGGLDLPCGWRNPVFLAYGATQCEGVVRVVLCVSEVVIGVSVPQDRVDKPATSWPVSVV